MGHVRVDGARSGVGPVGGGVEIGLVGAGWGPGAGCKTAISYV